MSCTYILTDSSCTVENPTKTITQKGNALLGLGQYDEAKECYESLRELGENSAADQYLKKLHDTQVKDKRYDSFFFRKRNFLQSESRKMEFEMNGIPMNSCEFFN